MSSNNPTGYNPTTINRPRSIFPINKRHITTLKIGEITPIFCEEVLPGDSWSPDISSVSRMAAPFVSPVYGDVTLSIYAFFCPNRLLWDHWFQFCGQNDDHAWTQTNEYRIPQAPISLGNQSKLGGIGDHLGLPVNNKAGETYINELPLRAYARIYNEYFRNENTDDPILINYGDEKNVALTYDSECLKACRFHDYFSNALPAPQKGPSVTVPLGGTAPIVMTDLNQASTTDHPLYMDVVNPSSNMWFTIGTNTLIYPGTGDKIPVSNMEADLSKAVSATINGWRLAAQTQIFYETCARYGTRYNELIYGLFGVKTGDTRAYRVEELGGLHFNLAMQEVTATSSSADNSASQYALGQQVVKLASGNKGSLFTKTFVEHGYLMFVAVPRVKHQYNQGIERKWTRETFLDFYNPIFDNIGETAVKQSEIYAKKENVFGPGNPGYESWNEINETFGYQEAWAEYRYFKDDVTGYMRPNKGNRPEANGLPTYTFADNYESAPTLNGFMKETRTNIQRTLALTSLDYDIMADFMITGKVARDMNVRSIPGLLDHHGI
jgi:hypothetical protein